MVRFDRINSLLFGAALFISAVPWVEAASPAALTKVADIHGLTNKQASQHLPVSFEANVTYFRWFDQDLFVQDGDAAVYVHATTSLRLVPGDRVLVRGTTRESFRPFVESADITRVDHGALPTPKHPTFEQMIRGETDCQYVTVRAIIRSADTTPDPRSPVPTIYLKMLVDGAPADANVDSDNQQAINDLLDAEVEITGTVSGHFDNKMQQTGILFHIQSLDGVRILKRAGSDPWLLPVMPMDRVITGYKDIDQSQRMRVQGTITYYQPGSALVLQDGSHSLWIGTKSYSPMRIGDRAEAIGFPDVQNGFLFLIRSEVRDSSIQSSVQPPILTWQDLSRGGNVMRGRALDLVSTDGTVVAEVRQSTEDEYVLNAGGHLFSAVLRHPDSPGQAPLLPMKEISLGSRVRVTGICMLLSADPFHGEVPFNILMRSENDIVVLARPSWLNTHNAVLLVTWLIILVLVVGMRGWYLEHKNRRQIGSLAYVEKRRARILEDMNHSKPLAGILERITELVSVRLNGAPCWCRVADGATLGNRPPQLDSSLRTVEHVIAARSGAAHGTIFAAFDARTKPGAAEDEALAMAAELATLAIETSRLYSDLVHRSEFDLLTEVQNRFAMEKTLRSHIHAARQSAGIFGLIYIDLNEFKQVNDVYGHQAGDQYLQEVTRRLKGQLRPGDTLARLGGDEFAILVSRVRNRPAVEEIAARLERCFDEPFKGDGYELRGSASIGIALYPEDANSADSLLRAADAAMYAAKYTRPGRSRGPRVSGG
ncbi:putative Diguanylate cyclase [Candidatus Sulfotelmatomonas gaucii]|uniref:Putative Diguanylate cyclase n=1 Tax=Candidatus Sulfuritelmatomonas gaucii TaxID=2043161 RepID=A0A2N9M5I7_9BACT|nr:putative Diguanylate cyclase [Candidatus Sulfotelmatomonas gaucii]